MTSVRLRELATVDIAVATEYYQRKAGQQLALDFIAEVERTLRKIGHRPQAGSLRFAYELGILDLRAVRLNRFPYVVFYIVGEAKAEREVDVWRVLHVRRDVTALIEPPAT